MGIKSKLYKRDRRANKGRQYPEAKAYYPLWVIDENGVYHYALFTEKELKDAIKRGSQHPEDTVEPQTMWQRLIEWFKSLV